MIYEGGLESILHYINWLKYDDDCWKLKKNNTKFIENAAYSLSYYKLV